MQESSTDNTGFFELNLISLQAATECRYLVDPLGSHKAIHTKFIFVEPQLSRQTFMPVVQITLEAS